MAKCFAGLDVSATTNSICIVDAQGLSMGEVTAGTTPAAIARALAPYRRSLELVGYEACQPSAWLHKRLLKWYLPMIRLDASRVPRWRRNETRLTGMTRVGSPFS